MEKKAYLSREAAEEAWERDHGSHPRFNVYQGEDDLWYVGHTPGINTDAPILAPRTAPILDRAPHRYENFAEERAFAYLAELDILGWKFVVRQDGSILIETPIIEGGGQPVIAANDAHRRLLIALFELCDQEPGRMLGIASDAPGLGRPA